VTFDRVSDAPAGAPGALFVVSAPSGAGKTTLIRKALPDLGAVRFSVSATTRPRRPGEREGVDYFFVPRGTFEAMVMQDEFLEWARVHENLYGTPAGPVRAALDTGADMLLDIDVQGALQVRSRMPQSVQILVVPPSYDELRRRIEGRGQDDPASVAVRLSNARAELSRFAEYDYVIINDDLGEAVENLKGIVRAGRVAMPRLASRVNAILSAFP
jgi:guanylate kinase